MDEEILAAVAAEAPAMTDLLAELVAAPTLLGDEAPGQAVMRRAFAGLGLEPFDVPLDPEALERHPAGAPFGWDVAGKANVLADWLPAGEADGRSLILNGHIDVVSPEPASLWSDDPYGARIDGEWMYGRGAGDMKSGLAAMVGAVRGLQRLGLAPRAKVQLQSVVEEECTGNGALACVLAGHTADAAILTEPTRSAIWNAQVGVLWFQVRVLGAPAHAGDADEGANAIEASYAVIGALRELEAELNVVAPAAVRRLPPPDPPQRRDDPRRRLAVDGRRRVRDPLPARALPRRARRDAQAARGADRRDARREPPRARAAAHRGALRGLPVRGLRARARRAADHRPVRRVRAHDRARRRRCSPRPRPRTRARSSSTATRPRSASARSRRTSTASTSASTCRR